MMKGLGVRLIGILGVVMMLSSAILAERMGDSVIAGLSQNDTLIGDVVTYTAIAPLTHPLIVSADARALYTVLYQSGVPKSTVIESIEVRHNETSVDQDQSRYVPIIWRLRLLEDGLFQIQNPFSKEQEVSAYNISKRVSRYDRDSLNETAPVMMAILPFKEGWVKILSWTLVSIVLAMMLTKRALRTLSYLALGNNSHLATVRSIQAAYIKELDRLRRKKWVKHHHEPFFFQQLGALLRRYFSEQFKSNYLLRQGSDILADLYQKGVPKHDIDQLKTVLNICDHYPANNGASEEEKLNPKEYFKLAVALISSETAVPLKGKGLR